METSDSVRARELDALLQASWSATTPAESAAARRALDTFYAEEERRLRARVRASPRRSIALAAVVLLAVGAGGLVWRTQQGPPDHAWLAAQTGPWHASPSLVGPAISPQALRAGQPVVLPRVDSPLRVDLAVEPMIASSEAAHAAAFFLQDGRSTLVYRATVAPGARFDPKPVQVPLPIAAGELVFVVVGHALPEAILDATDAAVILDFLTGDTPMWSARVPVRVP